MVTRSNYGGFDMDGFESTQTNKGKVTTSVPKNTPKKCKKCDTTVTNEEACPQCQTLTEGALPILLD